MEPDEITREQLEQDFQPSPANQDLPKEFRFAKHQPKENIIGTPDAGIRTRASLYNTMNHCAFISQMEPKTYKDSESDEHWIIAMQEELNQF